MKAPKKTLRVDNPEWNDQVNVSKTDGTML
jgi:hypothetical protein